MNKHMFVMIAVLVVGVILSTEGESKASGEPCSYSYHCNACVSGGTAICITDSLGFNGRCVCVK